jgi:hypothetical protein
VHPWWRDRCQILANSKTQTAYLFPVHAMFRHDCPPCGETCKYATAPRTKTKTWRDSLSIDMLLSAVSGLVVAQSSSEIPEGLMNDPVYWVFYYIIRLQLFRPSSGLVLGNWKQFCILLRSLVASSPLCDSIIVEIRCVNSVSNCWRKQLHVSALFSVGHH